MLNIIFDDGSDTLIIPVIIGTLPGNKLTKGVRGIRSSVFAFKFRSAQVKGFAKFFAGYDAVLITVT